MNAYIGLSVAHSMTSRQVIAALECARREVGLPLTITCDNGLQGAGQNSVSN